MKPHGLVVVLGVALAAAVSCSDNSPVGATGDAGTGGGAGTSGAAGSFGAAGTTGVAGTSGVVGPSTGISGTTGTAGAAGTSTVSCGAFGDPTLPSGKCATGAFKRNGVCTCQAITPNVCGDRCVDVMTDDANCGCCGNACGPKSTCNNGKCGPAPVQIVPPIPGCGSIDLTVRNGVIAWTEPGRARVMMMSVSGGAPTVVDAAAKPTTGIALDGNNVVFWLERGGVRRKPMNGLLMTVVAPMAGGGDINGFALDANGTAVFVSMNTMVWRTSLLAGGMPALVAQEVRGGIPMALAVDGSRVMYPTAINGDVDVASYDPTQLQVANCGKEGPNGEPINDITCLRVARSQGSLLVDKIVALPGRVLWADGVTLKTSSTTGLTAPANDVVGMTDSENITGFAANAMVAYFSERTEPQSPTGVIYRAVIGGNQISTRIARGQIEPRVGGIDQSRVYWSTGDCAIMATGL